MINVDVSASTEAFFETVCLIAVRHSDSGRTGCRGCGRVDKTPHLCDESESEWQMAIRQTVSKKASVEAETSTLIIKKVVFTEFYYLMSLSFNL